MTTYNPPKKNSAFRCYVTLISQANTKVFQANPTLAAGDIKVSIDGGAFANLATLPVVTPAAGRGVQVDLSAAEMNGDNILIVFSDVAGAEWCDLSLNLQTTARQIDDLTYPITSGRSTDVDASGRVLMQPLDSLVAQSGTAQAGAAGSITLAAGASATDSLYVGNVIKIYSGTGAGQARTITAYVGATKVATVGRNWAITPDATSVYAVLALAVPKVNDSLEVVAASVTASVLISSGSGAGQLDVTGGVIKANFVQVLGTALTETAGQIAAGIKQFFNIASPTSTMNTITNLTNAPTAGDLTATMKASVTTAATAATPVAASVIAAVTVATNNDKAGYALSGAGVTAVQTGLPTANANADALLDRVDAIEVGSTPRGALRLILAALAGKLSGAATTTVAIRNAVADSKARITATVDVDGNRTAITTDQT